jgi:hypothetical protein
MSWVGDHNERCSFSLGPGKVIGVAAWIPLGSVAMQRLLAEESTYVTQVIVESPPREGKGLMAAKYEGAK